MNHAELLFACDVAAIWAGVFVGVLRAFDSKVTTDTIARFGVKE